MSGANLITAAETPAPFCCDLFRISNGKHHHPTKCEKYTKPRVESDVFTATAPAPVTPPEVITPAPVSVPVMPVKQWHADALKDPAEAERRRDDGIARAHAHAHPDWLEAAYNTGLAMARTRARFTSADIDVEMMRAHPQLVTNDKRAMGSIVKRLCKAKVLEATQTVIKDPRPNCHAQNKRVLRSLLYNSTPVN